MLPVCQLAQANYFDCQKALGLKWKITDGYQKEQVTWAIEDAVIAGELEKKAGKEVNSDALKDSNCMEVNLVEAIIGKDLAYKREVAVNMEVVKGADKKVVPVQNFQVNGKEVLHNLVAID